MKRLFYSAALMLALLATGCGDANQKTSAIPQIDMNADYPEKEICLQDIAEVSYIPLETTDEFLLNENARMMVVSSKGILCVSDNKAYILHPDGKLRLTLDKRGEGPMEYRFLVCADVDWERKEIYVHDDSQKAVVVYSLDGAYKHKFMVDVNIRQHDFLNDNQGHLVFYREYQGKVREGKIDPYRPVVRLSLEDGKVDSLSLQNHYHTNMGIKARLGDRNVTLVVRTPALTQLNGNVYVSEVASDTIYRLVDDKHEPVIVRTPSVQNEGEKYLLYLQGIMPHHYYLRLQAKVVDDTNTVGDMIYSNDNKTKKLMYNKETEESYVSVFKNQDYQALDCDHLTFNGCDANSAYIKLEAFKLIEALEAGKLSGELKTIAEGLKEDDNPVLMVVKFKE